MKNKFNQERTLVLIKPDGIQRSLIGEVINRLERVGLKLVAMDFVVPTEEQMRKHYGIDSEWLRKVGEKAMAASKESGEDMSDMDPVAYGEKVLELLVKYMISGPVVSMVWQGAHSVAIVRKIVGSTYPLTSDVGTLRGDFVLDSYEMSNMDNRSVRNLVHASGTVEEAVKEIPLWFDEKDLISYRLIQEEILYDVNLDGILE